MLYLSNEDTMGDGDDAKKEKVLPALAVVLKNA